MRKILLWRERELRIGGWACALVLSAWCAPGLAAAQSDQPLSVGIVGGVRIADPIRTAGEMSRVLQEADSPDDQRCNRSFSITDVNSAAEGPISVTSEKTFDEAAAAGSHFVHVVREIRFCGEPGQFLGCTRQGGSSIVVAGIADPKLAGLVWVHEYGHATGLPHFADDPADEPQSLMHKFAVDLRGREVTPPECFSFLTRENPRGGPVGSGPFIGGTRRSVARKAAPRNLEEFVRGTYLHGLPLDEARRYGSEHVPALLKMLADPSEAAHAANILTTLGLIGDETVGREMMHYVLRQPRAPQELHEHQALSAAMLALGFLAARTGSETVLSLLLKSSEAEAWYPRLSAWGDATVEQAQEMADRAAMGLAVSGHPSAHAALREKMAQQQRRANDTASTATPRAAAVATATLNELLKINEQVNRHRLEGYYGWDAR